MAEWSIKRVRRSLFSCERTRVQLLGQTSLIQASIRSRSVKWAEISTVGDCCITKVSAGTEMHQPLASVPFFTRPAGSRLQKQEMSTCPIWAEGSWRTLLSLPYITGTLMWQSGNNQYAAAFYQHDCYILFCEVRSDCQFGCEWHYLVLVSRSVCVLQKIIDICVVELNFIGLSFNVKNNCLLLFGPR